MSRRTQAITRAVIGPTPSKPAYELLRVVAHELRYPPQRTDGRDERWQRLSRECSVLAGRIENALKIAERPVGEPYDLPVSFRWPAELVRRIDAARGDVKRSTWVTAALERELADTTGLSDLVAGLDDEPPTSVIDALRP